MQNMFKIRIKNLLIHDGVSEFDDDDDRLWSQLYDFI